MMRPGTDYGASTILAQLRLGDTFDEILGVHVNEDLSDIGNVDQQKEQ
jgi:hypothetical protein